MARAGAVRTAAFRDGVRAIRRGSDPSSSPTGGRRDLALWAAGLSFFGMLAAVPFALVAVRLAVALAGPAAVVGGMETVLSGLPGGHGVPEAVRRVTATGADLSWPRTLVALVIATMYGEGLRRAFRQPAHSGAERATGWRGRLGLLPVLATAPLSVLALLAGAPVVAPLYAQGRPVLGVLAGYPLVWLVVSVTLAIVYRAVAPGRAGWPAVIVGGIVTGSFVAGFLHGFLLFLAIPVEWSLPFGGLPVIGAVTALGLWLYLLHTVVLAGYRIVVLRLDRRRDPEPGARPARPEPEPVPEPVLDDWSRSHGGVRPSGPVAAYVRITTALAAPLARIPPDVISVLGVATLAGAVAAATGGRWGAAAATVLVVVGGVFDGLDGAVARRFGRERPLGAVVDAVADRAGDLALVALLAVLGASPALSLAVGALVLLHEYVRARAQGVGMSGVGAVTVAERPQRVVTVAVAAAGTAVWPGGTPLTGWSWAAVCAWLWLAFAVAGLVHLVLGVRAALATPYREEASRSTIPATISADSSTSGMPPPGWDEPPTR